MRKLASYFLFCMVAVSCGEVPGEKEKSGEKKNHLKMIFSELLDSSASICIQENQLVVFTEFKNHVELRSDTDGVCYVRYFTAHADTLTEDSIRQVSKDQSLDIQTSKTNRGACFDSLETYHYQYDSVFPVKIRAADALPAGNIVNSGRISACIRSDYFNSANDLYFFMDGRLDSVKIYGSQSYIDIFLADITGDAIPEIFAVRHFMMPSVTAPEEPMVELVIYKVDL